MRLFCGSEVCRVACGRWLLRPRRSSVDGANWLRGITVRRFCERRGVGLCDVSGSGMERDRWLGLALGLDLGAGLGWKVMGLLSSDDFPGL